MVKLYIADCDSLKDDNKFRKYYAMADDRRRHKVDALSEDAARACLGAYALLGLALEKNGLSMGEWTYSAEGKPRFADENMPNFSLSHSERYALCALSDDEVGCDIQYMRPFDSRIAKKVMSCSELSEYGKLNGDSATEYFYRIWTVKESYVKFTGEGLASVFSDIDAPSEGNPLLVCGRRQNVNIGSFSFGEYKVACCALSSVSESIVRIEL